MNFEYNEEQKMLKDSILRWAQDNYNFEQRRVVLESDEGFSRDNWSTFAELGWLSIPFAEEYGGYGGGLIDTAAIMEEFGKALLLEPIVPNLYLFGAALQKAGGNQAEELIPQIIEGSLMGALATYEPQSRFDLSNIQTTATEKDGYVLNGQKSMVLGGAFADKLVVSARTSGNATDEDGISLFVVDKDAAGLKVTNYGLMDGQKVIDIELDNVQLAADSLIGEKGNGYSVLNSVNDEMSVVLGAEALGIMQTLNAETIEYTKTRKQFGVPISVFQALQHRMVDCFMAYEQSKSMLYGTLCELTDESTSDLEARKSVLGLRAIIAKHGKMVGDEAIQLHGGMGMTDELSVGHYVKRLLTINLQFGSGDYFQKQFNDIAYG